MDWLIGVFHNPLVLFCMGLIVKYVPGVRQVIANRLIFFLNASLAWLAAILEPSAAHAAGGPLVASTAFHFLGLGGPLQSLGSSLWQAVQAWVIHEAVGRHWLPENPGDSKSGGSLRYREAKAAVTFASLLLMSAVMASPAWAHPCDPCPDAPRHAAQRIQPKRRAVRATPCIAPAKAPECQGLLGQLADGLELTAGFRWQDELEPVDRWVPCAPPPRPRRDVKDPFYLGIGTRVGLTPRTVGFVEFDRDWTQEPRGQLRLGVAWRPLMRERR